MGAHERPGHLAGALLWSKARKKTRASRKSRHYSIRSQKIALTPPRPAKRTFVEGALQKANGKWTNYDMFPGREFDDLDTYRAAKKQRKERRAAYSAQANAGDKRY